MSSEDATSAKSEQSSKRVKSRESVNNNDADDGDQLPKHWAKVASKKHPGKFYYFNVATKESLWEHPGKTRALEKEKDIIRNVGKSPAKGSSGKSEKVVQLKNDTQFKRKNLAKERLDKLQKQLEAERKAESEKAKTKKETRTPESPRKRVTDKSPMKDERSPSKSKRKQTRSDESPSKKSKSSEVSSKSKAIAKKTPPRIGTKRIQKDLKQEASKIPKASELLKDVKPLPITEASTELKSFKIPKRAKQEPVPSSIFVDIQKLDELRPSGSASPKTDLLTNVPQVESVSDSTPKLSYAQKLLEAIEGQPVPKESTITTIATPPFKPSQAPKLITSTPKLQALVRSEQDTPRSVKSPANERLAGIREKLAQEVAQQTVLLNEDAEMVDLSAQDDQSPEAMEWEDIPEEVALREVVAVRQLPNDGLMMAGSERVLDTTIPEYGTHLFDRIEYRRFVFLVMDTNVFLSHLKGVERLLEKGFPHIGQPILVVPYIVLQELDRIKHREQGKPLSTAASQSIRFLNEHLKRRDPRVKGQSTVEATVHLVPVENPDDHIINCCFQVRQIISGRAGTDLMLLSNDVNLRNKALVNGVPAFGYGELMAEADRIRFAADDTAPEVGSR